jgi:trans-aconitate 2-methyltransferase
MPTVHWDPAQYLRFADERTWPLHDLLARVPVLPGPARPTVLDIGCGPGNFDAPSHTLLAELRRSPRRHHLLGADPTRAGVHRPGEYLDTLAGAGRRADVWETTYSTLLSGPDPVLEWVRGTALRPVLGRLADPADQAAFLAEYGALLREAYPAGPHGTVFPFRRIFAVAVRD